VRGRDLPARSKVRFTAEVALADYSWDGTPEVSVGWGFSFAKGKPPEGRGRVRLPRK